MHLLYVQSSALLLKVHTYSSGTIGAPIAARLVLSHNAEQ